MTTSQKARRQTLSTGNLHSAVGPARDRAERERLAERLRDADATLWSDDREVVKTVANRLGWLRIASAMQAKLGDIERFASEVVQDGLTDVVLLGMGGSSLCPAVFGRMFPRRPGMRHFLVLDLTDPDAVQRVEKTIDLTRTLFVSASKSGKTVETLSHTEYFWHRVAAVSPQPGRQFVATTDAGSALQALAAERDFRRTFINPSDIGGRYSALSYFGLVAGALAGVPLPDLIESALAAEQSGLQGSADNPAVELGLLLGAAALAGRDKLTFVASPRIAPLVPWIEQLIAESTGKQGKGIIPIEGEPLGRVGDYRADRFFVFLRFGDDAHPAAELHGHLERSGQAFIEITIGTAVDIGAEFYHWELGTAVAGWVLGINPFDEPNVQESKDNTNRVLGTVSDDGRLTLPPVAASGAAFHLLGEVASGRDSVDVRDMLSQWLRGAKESQYVALLAYTDESERTEALLQRMRSTLLRQTGRATLRGYGPRYLHSIGQLYKGGPPVGAFMVITSDTASDQPIPRAPYTFQALKLAQAIGDAESIATRKRPLLHIHLPALLPGLESLAKTVESLEEGS